MDDIIERVRAKMQSKTLRESIVEDNYIISVTIDPCIQFKFQYKIGDQFFENFVSVESLKSFGFRQQEPLSEFQIEQIKDIFKENQYYELGEVYKADDEKFMFVFKSTLYCEKEEYVEMIDEMLGIHKEMHEMAERKMKDKGIL